MGTVETFSRIDKFSSPEKSSIMSPKVVTNPEEKASARNAMIVELNNEREKANIAEQKICELQEIVDHARRKYSELAKTSETTLHRNQELEKKVEEDYVMEEELKSMKDTNSKMKLEILHLQKELKKANCKTKELEVSFNSEMQKKTSAFEIALQKEKAKVSEMKKKT